MNFRSCTVWTRGILVLHPAGLRGAMDPAYAAPKIYSSPKRDKLPLARSLLLLLHGNNVGLACVKHIASLPSKPVAECRIQNSLGSYMVYDPNGCWVLQGAGATIPLVI